MNFNKDRARDVFLFYKRLNLCNGIIFEVGLKKSIMKKAVVTLIAVLLASGMARAQ